MTYLVEPTGRSAEVPTLNFTLVLLHHSLHTLTKSMCSQMAIADKWISVLKTKSDYEWDMGDIVHTLTNRCEPEGAGGVDGSGAG